MNNINNTYDINYININNHTNKYNNNHNFFYLEYIIYRLEFIISFLHKRIYLVVTIQM